MVDLSSDVLERQFGPTEIEILKQAADSRIIRTKVVSSGQILEISRVSFIADGVREFPEVHEEVMAGASMGKVFRKAGVAFHRNVLSVSRGQIPLAGEDWFEAGPVTILSVRVTVGPADTPYANILETYGPAVQWPEEA